MEFWNFVLSTKYPKFALQFIPFSKYPPPNFGVSDFAEFTLVFLQFFFFFKTRL